MVENHEMLDVEAIEKRYGAVLEFFRNKAEEMERVIAATEDPATKQRLQAFRDKAMEAQGSLELGESEEAKAWLKEYALITTMGNVFGEKLEKEMEIIKALQDILENPDSTVH